MNADVKRGVQLEIAHVLFVDAVGFSKLSLNEQQAVFAELTRIVRATLTFRTAEAADALIRLPTGDGMALVFSQDPSAPLECAVELSRATRNLPGLSLRMGIHSGPVRRVSDVNDQSNVTGAGINIAQRVMSCGDAGHILLSKRAADDLAEHEEWAHCLHSIGQCEVKHGLRLRLVNFVTSEVGNPDLPTKVRETALLRGRDRRNRRVRLGAVLGATAIALGSLIFLTRARNERAHPSVAVLPFEDLSADKQDNHLTDAIQNEILENLGKVSQLKVISRTSVMQYGSATRPNLREIARQLNVTHVVEGTVQLAAGRVRATVQLIDAKTDTQIWADKFERDMSDVLTVQSELAEKIAIQLVSQLSPEVRAAIQERPTSNLDAYDFYLRARSLIDSAVFNAARPDNLFEAVRLLQEAVSRDPAFSLAYYQLAHAHDQIYFIGQDHSPDRLQMAEAAIQELTRLRPNSGEVHLARAKHFYWGYLDYAKALVEAEAAQKQMPNNSFAFLLAGYINRREGRWKESTRQFERALDLDPRDSFVLQQIALTYQCLRDYEREAIFLDRAMQVAPNDIQLRLNRAAVELDQKGNIEPLRTSIKAILESDPNSAGNVADSQLIVARYTRNSTEATRALSALTTDGCRTEGLPFPKSFCEGLVAREAGNSDAAQISFERARHQVEQILQHQPKYAEALCVIGVIDAALNRKDDAVREGRLAVDLLPVTKDSINGALLLQYLGVIYLWTGEQSAALDALEAASKLPGYLSYGQLRLDPVWDPLRGDRRFEAVVQSLQRKTL